MYFGKVACYIFSIKKQLGLYKHWNNVGDN